MTLRQQLIDTGLFFETDTRDLLHEEVRDEREPFSGEPIKAGHAVRLKFDAFGDLVAVVASTFDPVMRKLVADNAKARMERAK